MSKRNVKFDSTDIKKLYRLARQKDIDKWQESRNKEQKIMERSRQLALQLTLEMKISDVEFQGDGTKVIFYYTAEGRVDFRELIKKYAILHQTGFKNFEEAKNELNLSLKTINHDEKLNYKIVPYFEKDLGDVYSAADLIISRSGSSSIFEIAAFGKPSILIPLPENIAANDHQRKNAYEYAKTGAAIVIEENNLNKGNFLTQIEKLFNNPDILNSMSESAKDFAKINAAKTIAEEILKLIK